jgi:hypothetical protein
LLGGAVGGGAASFLRFTRTNPAREKRVLKHVRQIVVLASAIGWLILLRLFDERLGIKRHSPPQYAATYACFLAWILVLFFAVRTERRWQKSLRPEGKAYMSETPGRTSH